MNNAQGNANIYDPIKCDKMHTKFSLIYCIHHTSKSAAALNISTDYDLVAGTRLQVITVVLIFRNLIHFLLVMHSCEVCSLTQQQWNQTEWNETIFWVGATVSMLHSTVLIRHCFSTLFCTWCGTYVKICF